MVESITIHFHKRAGIWSQSSPKIWIYRIVCEKWKCWACSLVHIMASSPMGVPSAQKMAGVMGKWIFNFNFNEFKMECVSGSYHYTKPSDSENFVLSTLNPASWTSPQCPSVFIEELGSFHVSRCLFVCFFFNENLMQLNSYETWCIQESLTFSIHFLCDLSQIPVHLWDGKIT